jgi:hypothetical protein
MGLNLGLFWRINEFNGPDLFRVESDGFTGVFWEETLKRRVGFAFLMPVWLECYTHKWEFMA